MKMKQSYYSGHAALERSQRNEAARTAAFDKSQQGKALSHVVTRGPLNKGMKHGSTGGYLKDPFRGLK